MTIHINIFKQLPILKYIGLILFTIIKLFKKQILNNNIVPFKDSLISSITFNRNLCTI